jgi:hypothetical protein
MQLASRNVNPKGHELYELKAPLLSALVCILPSYTIEDYDGGENKWLYVFVTECQKEWRC